MKLPIPIVALMCAIITGLCWGNYGAALAKGRFGFQGSPWPPYVMIGVAYMVIAIGGGVIGMWVKGDQFIFFSEERMGGTSWSFVAGVLGAAGALALTLAMVKGGGPVAYVVMAVVFGTAVSVAGFVGWYQTRGAGIETSPMLWIGIAGMAICAVIVAHNTPHVKPLKKSGTRVSAGNGDDFVAGSLP